MPHLSLFDRIKVIHLFTKLKNGVKDKYFVVSREALNTYKIKISESGVRRLVKKWQTTNKLADRPKTNSPKSRKIAQKCVISKKGLLERPYCLSDLGA
jgi:hypothetical protein